MPSFSSVTSRPIALTPAREAKVYGLFALAMGLTALGIIVGMRFAGMLLSSGVLIFCVIAELAIIFTANWWRSQYPLNYLLFGIFPLLSGLTVTPYLMAILAGYVNGGAILLNAIASTTFMALAAAVFARATSWDLSGMGKGLFFAIIGLLLLGILQLFVPMLRVGSFELLLSGAGVVIFALFTAYDIQRVQAAARMGMDPFMLALSLYLDIFNLFLYVLRFMTAISGQRR
ncbi:MAG: hypothetical protein G01um101425_830 [Candidatus Peregrinibacteria bacterium Gr01-1014_25]|nr:MAG: hypothetical protein G01um101425_830 [Candidatus Peregrinibacteria bacterium Gr01-1014_25]